MISNNNQVKKSKWGIFVILIYLIFALGGLLIESGIFFGMMALSGSIGPQSIHFVFRTLFFHQLLFLILFELLRRIFLYFAVHRKVYDYKTLFFSLENRIITDKKSEIINAVIVISIVFTSILIGFFDKSNFGQDFSLGYVSAKISLPLAVAFTIYFHFKGALQSNFILNRRIFAKATFLAFLFLVIYGFYAITTIYDGEQKIEKVDPLTYQDLSYGYSKDKNQVYGRGIAIAGADPSSFMVIKAGSPYGKDKNNVYFNGSSLVSIEGADVTSFQVLDAEESGVKVFGKDKQAVYFQGNKINDMDPNSFETINGSYYTPFIKDEKNVYSITDYGTQLRKLEDIDSRTFKVFPGNGPFDYFNDKNGVYFVDDSGKLQKINDADPTTFKVVGMFYSKDKNNVYFRDKKLAGADPATFEFGWEEGGISYSMARDKNGHYQEGIKTEI